MHLLAGGYSINHRSRANQRTPLDEAHHRRLIILTGVSFGEDLDKLILHSVDGYKGRSLTDIGRSVEGYRPASTGNSGSIAKEKLCGDFSQRAMKHSL